jgi:type II secretory pathway pseudopilin PulG
VELLVVVLLVGLMAALAGSDLRRMMGRYRMNAAAREFEKRVEVCRVAAITENRECAIHLLAFDADAQSPGGDNVGAYEVLRGNYGGSSTTWERAPDGFVDLANGPGLHPGVSIEPWGTLLGPQSYGLPDTLVFSPRGYIINVPTDFQDGVVRVVFRNKRASHPEGRVVRINKGGGARIAAVN